MRQAFENLDVLWPGGESSRAAMSRGRTAIDALLARPEQTQVAVTHGNLLTLILRSFESHHGDQADREALPGVHTTFVQDLALTYYTDCPVF